MIRRNCHGRCCTGEFIFQFVHSINDSSSCVFVNFNGFKNAYTFEVKFTRNWFEVCEFSNSDGDHREHGCVNLVLPKDVPAYFADFVSTAIRVDDFLDFQQNWIEPLFATVLIIGVAFLYSHGCYNHFAFCLTFYPYSMGKVEMLHGLGRKNDYLVNFCIIIAIFAHKSVRDI